MKITNSASKKKRLLNILLVISLISLGSFFIELFGIESINPFYYFLRTPYDIEHNVKNKIAKKFEYKNIYPSEGNQFTHTKFIGNNFSHYMTISYHLSSLDDCRLFFAELISQYLKEYNSEREIRPYFKNYPLTPRDIYFSFGIDDIQTSKRKITMICIKGRISFIIKSENDTHETIDTSENIFELYSEYKKNNPNEDILKKYKFL